ncbi:NUDIX domain-containing protein [Candidatus Saccharibacteria bacterium]|nr:NUDIX domain-containing protein [Candidatus Saccharibacteria bacterium]
MDEKVVAKGIIFELVQLPQPDGRVFEVARRAPGTRVIVHDTEQRKILFIKEFRRELGEWDYRLPGGKVFDSLDEYSDFRASGADILEAAKEQAKREAQQEAGVEVDTLEFVKKSVLGATVEWDLYVFEATSWQLSIEGQELEVGEVIDADTWVTYDQAKQMILTGEMQEDRIALILLQWLEAQV